MNGRTTKTFHRKERSNVTLVPTAAAASSRAATASAGPAPAGEVQPNAIIGSSAAFIEPEQRQAMIAEAAYYRAEHRGFEPGHEFEDWCAAEAEIDGMLTGRELPLGCGV